MLLAGCNILNQASNVPQTTTDGQANLLFLQNANSGSFIPVKDKEDTYTLTLNNISPLTVYFSDRPYKIAGEEATEVFVHLWESDDINGFGKNPPNAAIDITNGDNDGDVIIVTLKDPVYDKSLNILKYTVTIVNNSNDINKMQLFTLRNDKSSNIPANFGAVSLFIDSLLSKISDLKDEINNLKNKITDYENIISNLKSDTEKVTKLKDKAQDALNTAINKAKEAEETIKELKEKVEYSIEEVIKDPIGTPLEFFHKTLNIVLPQQYTNCAKFEFGISSDVIYEIKSPKNASWMSDLASYIENLTIREISMPGTHDTGTYAISEKSEITPEIASNIPVKWDDNGMFVTEKVNSIKAELEKYLPADRVTEILAIWAKAQRHSIYAQLQGGVRYFDLRVIVKNNEFYIEHSLYSAKLDTILNDINLFIAKYPKEILILDFQSLKGENSQNMSPGDVQKFAKLITQTFSSKLVKNVPSPCIEKAKTCGLQKSKYEYACNCDSSLSSLKIKDIWDKNAQIIALIDNYDSSFIPYLDDTSAYSLWPRDEHIYSYWTETSNPADLIDSLNKNVLPNINTGCFNITDKSVDSITSLLNDLNSSGYLLQSDIDKTLKVLNDNKTTSFGTYSDFEIKILNNLSISGLPQFLQDLVQQEILRDCSDSQNQGNSSKLFVIQGQNTPVTWQVIKGGFLWFTSGRNASVLACLINNYPEAKDLIADFTKNDKTFQSLSKEVLPLSLKDMAFISNPKFIDWLKTLSPEIPNIVIADFMVDHSDLVDYIIELNKRKK